MPWIEKLILSGVTIWGGRLFYRISSRTMARGKDDPRYTEAKRKNPNFWNSALVKQYLPESVFLTFITLPFTLPFRMERSTIDVEPKCSALLRALGVGIFTAGLTMEVLADAQLEKHRKKQKDLCRTGVWSIVRHPKYVA